jgi:hypothetical protein
MSPADLLEMRRLWEDTPQNASQIGALFGVSRCVVLGHAHRKGWASRGPSIYDEQRTLTTRLDALHAAFDRAVSGA